MGRTILDWKAERDKAVSKRAAERVPKKPSRISDDNLTFNHLKYLELIASHRITFCTGPAGTGKTSLACQVAARALKGGAVERLVLVRPLVQCDGDVGTLPGALGDKVLPYLQPMARALAEVLGDEVDHLTRKGVIEVAALELMRGNTYHDAFVILDEAENATRGQLRMFLTRMGENSKFVVTGDVSQSDLRTADVPLEWAIARLKGHKEIAAHEFTYDDVLRPGIVTWIDSRLQKSR